MLVGDTGIEPVTSSASGTTFVLSTPPLSTKIVHPSPPLSTRIRARYQAISHADQLPAHRWTTMDVPAALTAIVSPEFRSQRPEL
jgi:hypothetical protein